MHMRPVKFMFLAAGQRRDDWSAALADGAWARRAEVLKADDAGRAWVRAASLMVGGSRREVVIKARHLEAPLDRLKTHLGNGRGRRHVRGAALLSRFGIPTAAPLALLRAAIDGPEHEVLVLERLRGPTLLELMRDSRALELPLAHERALADAVGAQIARFSRSRLRNRDHKPSNILVPRLDEHGAELAVVDCVAISRRVFPTTIARMLASLVIEPLGCGVAPRRSLLLRALLAFVDGALEPYSAGATLDERDRRRIAWSVWRNVAAIVARHGDPRPRHNPLGQAAPQGRAAGARGSST